MPTYTSIDWSTAFFGAVETLAALGSSANMTRGRGIMGIYGNYLSGALSTMWLQDARPTASGVSSVKVGVASGLTAGNRTGARTTLGKNGMVAVGVVDGTSFKTYKETAVATYAARGVVTIQASTCQGSLLYDSASDTYHYINARLNGSSKDEVVHWVSTDDMANWTEHASPDLYTPGTQLKSYQGNGTNACLDDSGNIHVVIGCASGAGTQSLQYLKWTKATDSWSSPTTIDETGQSDTAATFYHYLAPQIVSTPDGYLHVVGHRRSATHALYRPYYFTNRTGSWSAGTIIGGDVAYTRVATMMPRSDSTLAFIVCGNGYSPNTANFQLMRYEMDSAGTIGASEVIDSNSYSTDCFGTIMRAAEAPEAGVILWAARASGSSNLMFQSSDLTWRVEDPPVTSVSRGTQVYAGTGLSHSGDGANFFKMRYGLARTTAGRIWAIYPGNSLGSDYNRRTIYAKYSDDDGATWSAQETVYDKGSTATYPHWQDIVLDANEDPVVLIHELGTATIRFYRRESAVWTAKTSVTMDHTPAFASPRLSYNRTQAKFHLFVYRYVANASYFTHYESSDNCATWSSPDSSSTFGGTNSGNHGTTMLGYDAYMDDTGVHHVAAIGVLPTSNYRAVYYATRDTSGTWSTPAVAYSNTATTGNCYGLNLIYDGVIPRIMTAIDLGIGRQGYLSSKDPLGSWSTTITPAATNPRTAAFVLCGDGSTWCLAHTNSAAFNLGHFKFRSGRMQWENISNELVATPSARDGSIVFGNQSMQGDAPRFRDGFFFLANGADAASWYTYKSSSITWGGLTGSYNVDASHTLNFTQVATPQGWVTRTLDSDTVTRIPGGGRQIVRGADGTLWACYYDGTIKVAYSTDEGVHWTETDVGPTWQPAGMCLAIGDGDVPALVASKSSNDDFYFYLWDGSAWVYKSVISQPTNQSESFQLLYSGSTYHFLYGHVTGSGDRHVKHKTSSNLTTWSSATTIKNGDGSGTGPHKYRRVAACVDGSGYLHLAYSIRSGGSHTLFYKKYTGSWSSEETIETHYGGNNVSDYASGLSIAVDANGTVHLAARVRDTTFTSNVKIRYWQKVTSWIGENVHDSTDADQDFPSLSLNGTRPIICWASVNLDLGVVRALRATDGSGWMMSTISNGTYDTVQTVQGPSFGTTYGYSRGVVGSMRGSMEYFASSDAVPGTSAYAEHTLSFAGIASTQQRVATGTFTLGGVADSVRSIGAISSFSLSGQASIERPVSASNTFNIAQIPPSGTTGVPVTQTLNFSGLALGVKDQSKLVTHGLNFTQNATLSKDVGGTGSFELSQLVATNLVKRKSASSTINFAQVVDEAWTVQKPVSQTINFTQGALGFVTEGCETSFSPTPAIPADEDDILNVWLQGPWDLLTYSVQLRRPEFGNDLTQELQVVVHHTRGGTRRVFTRTPSYETQILKWVQLSRKKRLELRRFLRATKGQDIRYTDENGWLWRGVVTSSSVPLTVEDRDQGGEVTITFEGEVVQ